MQNSCELGQSWEQDLVACLQHGACSLLCITALPGSPLISSAGQSKRSGGSNASAFPYPLSQQPPDWIRDLNLWLLETAFFTHLWPLIWREHWGQLTPVLVFLHPSAWGGMKERVCACILFYRSQVLNNSGGRRTVRNELQHYCSHFTAQEMALSSVFFELKEKCLWFDETWQREVSCL